MSQTVYIHYTTIIKKRFYFQCTEEYKVTDQIYFDIHVDDAHLGRIIFGLFGEVVPKTVRNFKEIALKGIDGKSYLGTKFHTAIERIFIQGKDNK
nr:unnamed protein product [Callosobruchus chinensis]